MVELKTRKTQASVTAFIAKIKDPTQRADSETLLKLMERATGEKGRMWGDLIGFKDVHLRYASGRELDWFTIGFAPRKDSLSIYLCCAAHSPKVRGLLTRLGPHTMGVGCLTLKNLEQVDRTVLGAVIDVAAGMSPSTAMANSRSAMNTDAMDPAQRKSPSAKAPRTKGPSARKEKLETVPAAPARVKSRTARGQKAR